MSLAWKKLLLLVLLLGGFALFYQWSTWSAQQRMLAERGVLRLDSAAMQPGLNLFCSMNQPRAYLMDSEGKLVNTWRGRGNDPRGWHYVRLVEGGELFAVMTDTDLRKMSWDSAIRWRREGRFHHDVDVASNGKVYSLARKDERVAFEDREVRILNDYITELSSDGEVVRELSLYDATAALIPTAVMEKAEKYDLHESPSFLNNDTAADIFHTNALSYIDTRPEHGIFDEGQVLVGIREIDTVAVIDLKSGKVVWHWGVGELERPHHPTLLPSGNILVFDNGVRRGYSRVLEVDPSSNEIVWTYGEKEQQRFYSAYRGGAQRLPNGNTLVTVGESGEVFEITPNGEEVWRFRTPYFKNREKTKRETIYRMTRVVDPPRYSVAANIARGTSKTE